MENDQQANQTAEKEVIIVTGGSGLIGSQLIKRLAKNYLIIGLDKTGSPFPPIEAECICFDITDEKSIRTAMERVSYAYGNKIASVIHLAAYYDFSGKPSPLYEEVTVKGTEKFLRVLQDFEVKQFIFSSTNLIYKPKAPDQKIGEDAPLEPSWDYPKSKVSTEKIIHEQRGNIPAVILRLAGAYDDEGHSIPIAHQIQRIYEKRLTGHFYSGDVTHGNVFLHLEDLLDAIEKTIAQRNNLPEEIAINIGEPETPSYKELQETIGRLLYGKEWKTYQIPKPLAKAGARLMNLFGDNFIKPWMIDRADDHYELNINRAKTLLDWQPEHSLMTTLPMIIKNLEKDPASWYQENRLKRSKEMKKKKSSTH